MALDPAWIGVIGTGIGALASGIPAFATAAVQSVSARSQRKHDAAQAEAKREADAAEAKAQRDHDEAMRQRQRRYASLDSWRAGIAGMWADEPHTDVLGSDWYETLRPYLSKDALTRLEQPRVAIVNADTGSGAKDLFTGEVDRVEHEWGLRQ